MTSGETLSSPSWAWMRIIATFSSGPKVGSKTSDRNVAEPEGRYGVAVGADIDRLRAFGADGGAAAEIDAVIQALDEKADQCEHHQEPRDAEPEFRAREEVPVRLGGDEFQTHLRPLSPSGGGARTTSRSEAV